MDRTVKKQPKIDTLAINELIANRKHTAPGKLLRSAQPPFLLRGHDRILLHADLNGVTLSDKQRQDLEEAEFCKCSVYRDPDGNFEFRDRICYKVWPVTNYGALARHIRAEHLSLPVEH